MGKKLNNNTKIENYDEFVKLYLNGNFVERKKFKLLHSIYVSGFLISLVATGLIYGFNSQFVLQLIGSGEFAIVQYCLGLIVCMTLAVVIWYCLFVLAFRKILPKEAFIYYRSSLSRRLLSQY